jgi:glyoxylase-like metal-dependent hydrolase (beta-lactamase superfamily II)
MRQFLLRLYGSIEGLGENLGKVDILLGMDATHKMVQTSDAAHPDMIYMRLPVGMLQCNCQIIGDPKTLEAIVIDPGDEVERILGMLGRYKLSVKAIISTHAHIDHVGGLSRLHMCNPERSVGSAVCFV